MCAVHLIYFLNSKDEFYSSAFLMIYTVAFQKQLIFYDWFILNALLIYVNCQA